jgi:hypothetical protein
MDIEPSCVTGKGNKCANIREASHSIVTSGSQWYLAYSLHELEVRLFIEPLLLQERQSLSKVDRHHHLLILHPLTFLRFLSSLRLIDLSNVPFRQPESLVKSFLPSVLGLVVANM